VRLIWVRHGETEGKQQARMVAEWLSQEPVSAIYSSDLCRAKETASAIAAHHPSIPVRVTPLLRECAFGEWEGRTYDEIAANGEMHLRRWYEDPWHVSPPGGECLQDMERRMSHWLEALAIRYRRGDTLVVVAHAGPIRLFHSKWVKRNPRALWEFSLPHGGVWVVSRRGDGWEEEPWNPS
jgi:broad specificity phosphatase PhoE